MDRAHSKIRVAAIVGSLLLFFVLVGIPLAHIFSRMDFRSPPRDLFAISSFSVLQAGLSVLGSLVIGVPLGFYYSGAWTPPLRGLLFAAFSMPSLLVIGGVNFVLRGTSLRFSLAAVILAHVFLNAPWIALATAEGVRSVPHNWKDAARTLGASRIQVFRRVEFPWILRRLALASAQVFALCLMSFAIVLVLGGGPPVVSLETEVYASVRGGGLEFSRAAWVAAAQFLIGGFPLLWVAGFTPRRGFHEREFKEKEKNSSASSVFVAGQKKIPLILAALWFFIPILLFSIDVSFSQLFKILQDPEIREATLVSIRVGLLTVILTLGFGAVFSLGARYSRVVRVLAGIPIGLSPLMIALGFYLSYSHWIDPFSGSELGMVLVQTTLFLPFTLRFFLPLLEEEKNQHATARSLGATPWRAWKILEWPRWRGVGLRLAGLLFVWSFFELAAASFFGSERLTTVGVLLVRWMVRYRFEDVNAVLFIFSIFSCVILYGVGSKMEDRSP